MASKTDGELWGRAAAGDAEAFGDLYERHDLAVQAFSVRRTGDLAVAEDITSMVFLEAWRRRAELTLSTPTARPLLLGIATNLIRTHWRSRRRHKAALDRLQRASLPRVDPEAEMIERVAALQRVQAIRQRLQAIPRHELDVLTLVAWGELSYEETAAALDVPIGTVRSRLSRARSRMGADPGLEALVSLPPRALWNAGGPS
jgi:RNA polymerase sigma factor (sigma-70 family)